MPMHDVVVRWIAWRWAIGPGQERLSPAGRPSPTPAHGRGAVPVVVPSPAHTTEPVLRHTALGQCSRDGLHATVCRHRTEQLLGVVVNWPSVSLTDDIYAPCWSVRPNTDSREAHATRKLIFGMNLSLDGYIAAPGEDLGWSAPSDELFQWWSDRVGATGLALYGRKLW